MSRPPQRSTVSSTRRSQAPAARKSAAANCALPPAARMASTTASPRCAWRPDTMTLAPDSAKTWAQASPIPVVEPVTRTTFPANIMDAFSDRGDRFPADEYKQTRVTGSAMAGASPTFKRIKHVPRPQTRCAVRAHQDTPQDAPQPILADLALRRARRRETRRPGAFTRHEGRGRLGRHLHRVLLHSSRIRRVSLHLRAPLG